tara:strand:- start:661 stop:1356 length:696 start_codon:yes stop_codon:yes gene_type:complete
MATPILMYHSIVDDHEESVSIKSFERQMIFMKKMGYQTINFNDLNKDDNKKKFIITFDDGYENIFLNALPILKKLGFNATCFIIANKINYYNDWDINKKNFKKMKLMDFEQISKWLSEGFEVGSHTMDHKDITKLNDREKVNQIVSSKKFLSKIFKTKIDSFAYPFGLYDLNTKNIVKEYYDFAVTTKRSRYIKNKFNNHLLPRVPISKSDNLLKFFLKIKTFYEDVKFNN